MKGISLPQLLSRFGKHPTTRHIEQNLLKQQDSPARIRVEGLAGSQTAFVLSTVANQPNLGKALHVFIDNTKDEAAYRYTDLLVLLGEERALFFPDSFKKAADFNALNATQVLQRAEVVSRLSQNTEAVTGAAVLLTYPEALFEKVVKPDVLRKDQIVVNKGERLDLDFVISVLTEYHFQRTDFVYEPGQFSIRGGIVDLFSYSHNQPYRIELFDDEVETIRVFDPLTQLSVQQIEHLTIVPNLNIRFRQDQKVSLLDILPQNTVLWIRDQDFLEKKLLLCFEQAEKFAHKVATLEVEELREIFRDRAFLYPGEVTDTLKGYPVVFVGTGV
jgi:transcription-repair coupling factor (superfamily II helicase)